MFKTMTLASVFITVLCLSTKVNAQQVQIPEIGVFFPSITKVKPKEVSVVDGLWSVSSIDKVVRIDRGRIYAIDGWLHMFVLNIKPGTVVIHPFTEQFPGIFVSDDLPLQGPLRAELTGDRILDVTVKGALGDVNYQLIPQKLDDPAGFNALVKEVREQGR
ncbi:hypothetical protein ACOI22_11680 [Glaciecola sp. 2405UD65-10]|uniref:hypothetical protein n=1 Tax=Glaciecola sp. 2405UD65-10 TaxID=3397244 RepID=UPI003B5A254E